MLDSARTHCLRTLRSLLSRYLNAFLYSFLNSLSSNLIFDKMIFEYSSMLSLNFLLPSTHDENLDYVKKSNNPSATHLKQSQKIKKEGIVVRQADAKE